MAQVIDIAAQLGNQEHGPAYGRTEAGSELKVKMKAMRRSDWNSHRRGCPSALQTMGKKLG